ncbi:MAG TPA: NAD-dependent epimerase/dehydratase family protein [Phycisphaerales bacterium]|nr:NAD-dependent epimerase/dehydratase family protein [Phycisphaerales bacterium]
MKPTPEGNGRMHGSWGRGGAHVLITGGAGFVGTNIASRLCREGRRVVLLDNLSRAGVERNVAHLRRQFPGLVELRAADVQDTRAVRDCLADAAAVVHLAAQVAVTSSLSDPAEDLRVNVLGTFGLLEELRRLSRPVPMIFTSTNKVYGDLSDLQLERADGRYRPVDERVRRRGVDELRPLDFHSPYGCSKGAADQYILDYSRSYGLPTAVFRMSCIYGVHQCGNEDQGWVAHMARSALERRPITIYGDGRQVRDVLFAGDLVEAFMLALSDFDRVRARAFNIGGGPENTLSLRELIAELAARGLEPQVAYDGWRRGDQRWYVSDTGAFRRLTGWTPAVGVSEGIDRLIDWLREAQNPPAEAPDRVAATEVARR